MAKTILVADDNPRIRQMLCRMFEADNDYDICAEAANGQEAIALALEHRPDLIILDISMPVLDGIAAARELKKVMPHVPIILFTQFANLSREAFGPNGSMQHQFEAELTEFNRSNPPSASTQRKPRPD